MIVAQAAMLAHWRAEVAHLKATVEELAQRLGRHSRHSSQPPAADPPQTPPRPRCAPSGRRAGGQPGHEGQARALRPVEAVDGVIPVTPVPCLHGQHPVPGAAPQPQRPQVTEIPRVTPVVTASQWHRLVGPRCGEATRAAWPAGVPSGGFGPRVQAITARCTGAYHLSKRTTQTVLADRLGVALGLGPVANLEQATVQAWVEPVAEARALVHAPPAASLDETGWREGRRRAWLWTAVTAGVTVGVVRLSRGAIVAQALLGERCWGWLVTERWSASPWSPVWRRHVCWAHRWRDVDAMLARGGQSRAIGAGLRTQAHQMLHWWHRGRDGTLAPARFGTSRRPLRQEVERRLEAGHTGGVPQTAGVCREILHVRRALWTCVRPEEVEPTHQTAARAIRPGVLWRKGSLGTQRAEGSRFVETMMTVVATRKPQQRPVLDYLTTACEAALCAESVPSWLPTPDALPQGMRPAA